MNSSKFFRTQWQKTRSFHTNYRADGQLRDDAKFIGTIALLIPVINQYDSSVADEIYKIELQPYLQDEKNWQNRSEYYGKNLAWFGYYMYGKKFRGCAE